MKTVGTAQLKARLSEHLRAVRAGESLIVPIARLVPFEDGSALLVEPAQGSLHDFPWPEPAQDLGSTAALREERGER